jgi:UDP-glucose 4-epimerase
MAKILVTGGAGFIGSNLVDKLIEKGHEVAVIDNLSTGKKEFINPKAKFFKADLRDFETIRPLFKNIDFVFHLAALPRVPLSVERPRETNEINVTATLNMLVAVKEAEVKRVIYSASSSAYGIRKDLPLKEDMRANPISPYALQKYVGELYCKIFCQLYNLSTVSLRYFNVYGPRQPEEGSYTPVVGLFLTQKKKGLPLTITEDGEQTRDFTHVSDVVNANILAMKSDKVGKGEVVNIGAGCSYSVNKIAELIGGETKYIPPRRGDVRDTLADIGLAKELLDWEPKVSLEQGIKELKNEQ